MKIKCISNDINSMAERNLYENKELNIKSISGNDQMFITVGKVYIVYAITTYKDCMWYYIAEDIFSGISGEITYFPVWYPAELFEIVDNKISSTWVLKTKKNADGTLIPFMSFPEWANNNSFYEDLVDGNKDAFELFMKYKNIIDDE